jgi:ubiquinone biosynthesis protein
MALAARLVRALAILFVLVASYLVHLGLARLFRGQDGSLPPWLVARRRRVDSQNAKRLLAGMLRLRGVYIKLGQVLSVMGGFLPRAYAKELEQLQDQVPPHPFRDVAATIEESLGKPPSELYRDIAEEPIAAASLGQVHVAHLHDGTKVAVKVLYRGIRDVIAVDMRVLRLGIAIYKRFVPVARLERVHHALVDLLRRETDYLHEAECMRRLAKNFADDPSIAVPGVVDALTTREVLTMTFMEGLKITRLDELRAAGVDSAGVAEKLVQAFYKMLFVDRFFHADPHPGNFLVEPLEKGDPRGGAGGGRLVILDFGAICEAEEPIIDGMLSILEGFFAKDDAAVLRGFRRMGFVAEGANEALLERTVVSYFKRLLAVEDRSAGALMRARPEELERLARPEATRDELQELFRAFEYPEGWFYVERAVVMMFWLAGQIAPSIDTLAVGFPYVLPLVLERQAKRNAEREAAS